MQSPCTRLVKFNFSIGYFKYCANIWKQEEKGKKNKERNQTLLLKILQFTQTYTLLYHPYELWESNIFKLWHGRDLGRDFYFFKLDVHTLNSPSCQSPGPIMSFLDYHSNLQPPVPSHTCLSLRFILHRAAKETGTTLKPPSTSFLLHLKSNFKTLVFKTLPAPWTSYPHALLFTHRPQTY